MFVKNRALKGILPVILFLSFSSSPQADSIYLDSSFGKRADQISNVDKISEPKKSKTKKAYVTDNKFGFDVLNTEKNWVVEAFLNDIKPDMIVMDVGAGYGALTRSALKLGALVINNEISIPQQLYNLSHITPEQKSRLYLNNKDIRKINLKQCVLDGIIFHRILHFFNGKDIEKVLRKAHYWLKPKGKIYIVMMSKDHVAFRNDITYDNTKKWPGEDLVIVKKHLPEQAYAIANKTLHVVSLETIEQALKSAGFQVEKTDYVSLQKLGNETKRDGKEAVGIIGIK